MAFYAGRVILEPEMANPTLVILTDRNDLDDQLFGTFSRCKELLRQPPVQAESRAAPDPGRRQGDDRLYESTDLHGPTRRNREAAPSLVQSERR
jgi:hypothetical protein